MSKWLSFKINQQKVGLRHTACASAIPASNNSSCKAWLDLADVSFLTSLFNLVRSDLYSLSLASNVTFTLGCKLLASRSIFRIWQNTDINSLGVSTKRTLQQKEVQKVHYQNISLIQSSLQFRNMYVLLLFKT